ncbi:hypothetical protein EMIT019CA3_70088 [Bacillus pseudomycoides]
MLQNEKSSFSYKYNFLGYYIVDKWRNFCNDKKVTHEKNYFVRPVEKPIVYLDIMILLVE